MIKCILCTDMTKHFDLLKEITKLSNDRGINKDFNLRKFFHSNNMISPENLFEIKLLILSGLIHGADIANPSREFNVAKQFTYNLFEELFNQGDLEKGQNLNISFLCDRSAVNIPSSQIGFISNLVRPYFEKFSEILEGINEINSNLKKNELEWAKLKESESNKII